MIAPAHIAADLDRARIARERAYLRLHALNQALAYSGSPDTRAVRRAIASYHHVTLELVSLAFRFSRWHQATHRARRAA